MDLKVDNYQQKYMIFVAMLGFCMPIQGSFQRDIPVGWGVAAAVGLVGSVAGAYTLAAAKMRLKKIRAELAKKPRRVKLQVDEENAHNRVFAGSALLTLAGLLTLLSAYKVKVANTGLHQEQKGASTEPARMPDVPLKPGAPGYKETRSGYDSKGHLLSQWLPLDSQPAASIGSVSKTEHIYFNWQSGLWCYAQTGKPLPDDEQKRRAETSQ